MSGRRGKSGSPERGRSGGPAEKQVSYEADLGSLCCYDTLSLRDSGSESARVWGQDGNLCGDKKDDIVVFDGNVEMADVRSRRMLGFAGEDAGPSDENLVDVSDCYGVGELVGSLPMKWDVSGVDIDYRQFLEMLRVDGTSYSVELPVLDGLSLVLEYERGASAGSSSRQPTPQERSGSRKRTGKEEGNAAPVDGQTKPQTSGGSREQNGEEDFRKRARREHVDARDERRKRKFGAVSTGVKKGSRHVKTRAFEPGTCKPRLQASIRLVAESDGLQNSQVQNEKTPDETWLNLLNSLKKGSQHVKKRAFETGTCKPRLQASKRLVAESDGLQNSQVQNEKTPDETWLNLLNSLKKDGNQLRDVPTGVKKGSQHVKTRAFDPGTCKPRLQAGKRLVAESDGLQNSNEKTSDETWLSLLNSLEKDGNQLRDVSTGVKKELQHPKTRAFESGTCKPDARAGKLRVAESARFQNSHVQNEAISDAGQNNQSSSDLDVMILDVKPSKSDTPLVVLDDDDEVKNFCSRNDCPQLKQLSELLKLPCRKSELKAHMIELRSRRPLQVNRDLRSGRNSYNREFLGRSYDD